MEMILQHIQEILGVPEFLINQCKWLPEIVKTPLITSLRFVPWLYFLYYAIELVERFFLKHINLFVKFTKKVGVLFGASLSLIPECGYQVIVANFYSRKMVTRGTLLAFFIACSDDALPLLFLDMSKAPMIIPILAVKFVVAIVFACAVDFVMLFNSNLAKGLNFVNTDINEAGCCHHRITNMEHPAYWWTHPLIHTFNVFMFTFLSLIFIDIVVKGFGGIEPLSNFLMINSPISIVICAFFGLIPNSVISIFLALLFVYNIISFPAFVAGLISVTGLGLGVLLKHQRNGADNCFIIFVLLLASISTGLFLFYSSQVLEILRIGG